jgi:site-specific DNA recombinase
LVRQIFERFLRIGSVTILAKTLCEEGLTNRRGNRLDKMTLYRVLSNRVYLGQVVHKDTWYPGEHKAIIDQRLWDRVHEIFRESPIKRASRTQVKSPALLKGLIFGPSGRAMTPTSTRKKRKAYRYYTSIDVLKHGRDACPVGHVPAAEIEAAVLEQVRGLLRGPEIVARTWHSARQHDPEIGEADVAEALQNFDALWDELFPTEQARIIQLLVERVDVRPGGMDIKMRIEGIGSLVAELRGGIERRAA